MRFQLGFITSLLLFSKSLFAQADSVQIVQSGWNKSKLAGGVHLFQKNFKGSLFKSNQYVSIVEVKTRKRNKFKLAYERQLLRHTSDFGESSKATAAINGSFFDVKNGGSVDYIKANDSIISGNRLEKDSTRARHQKAAIIIDHNRLDIAKWDGSAEWEQGLKASNILLSGPLLIYHDSLTLADTSAFARLRHPRTAIAKKGNKTYLITVDGRNDNAAGMSLYELEKFLKWFGANNAINLDGGGSTTLWVNARKQKGIVNHPSDNKKWDHEGERKVANAILLIRN
ncbi:phosphodiester glycosidase family protein [Pedobacter sp. HMF7647]|uniref:Phosphodiester glycosidase family protein n=1 Tax=Hufsiella arboris TaxID=2695275 RepID=A0A7K1Y456_9SPHI|nr:phosphodiester glycosidase family protein [Hufsiella arboris]MXV49353.1 phosphodiester glycosidase family protein [Hufsiella arboris]